MDRIDATPELRALFAEGKMLGVLMVESVASSPTPTGDLPTQEMADPVGHDGIRFLYGFSGLAGGRNRVEGFVPPIFDLLDPDGHFKQEEARIVALTAEIRALSQALDASSSPTPDTASSPAHSASSSPAPDTSSSPAHYASSSPAPTGDLPARLKALRQERRERSIALQEWIFEAFLVNNARGERLSIAEVFAREGLVPPGGTGECAAPKLLQYAYLHGLKPLAMGEFWYGTSPVGELRRHGSFYPACTGKCGPLLRFMLEGLDVDPDPLRAFQVQKRWNCTSKTPEATSEGQNSPDCTSGDERWAIPILYEDEALLVIDKPSGLLSVPGRANPVSVVSLLEKTHGPLFPCHRLDMDTSGLMVYAKTPADQAAIQQQFAGHTVRKTYCATLIAVDSDGDKIPGQAGDDVLSTRDGAMGTGDVASAHKTISPGARGRIDLPIGPDWYDRPRQIVDKEKGRRAVTEYKILAVHPDGTMEVRFTPHTGRTHQLRVHAAHPEGLGRPILGDRLYGGHTPRTDNENGPANDAGPLRLKADTLSFRHPRTGTLLTFTL